MTLEQIVAENEAALIRMIARQSDNPTEKGEARIVHMREVNDAAKAIQSGIKHKSDLTDAICLFVAVNRDDIDFSSYFPPYLLLVAKVRGEELL